jgi:hypothetical protein
LSAALLDQFPAGTGSVPGGNGGAPNATPATASDAATGR